jgi:hypothetical protein
MNVDQEKIQREFKEIVKDATKENELEHFIGEVEQEAKNTKCILEILKVCAFSDQKKVLYNIYQANYFMEYSKLLNQEISYIKAKKGKAFLKETKNKRNLVKKTFIEFKKADETRIAYHKELEKRLGFQFEVGQGGYMSAYIGAKVGDMLTENGLKKVK